MERCRFLWILLIVEEIENFRTTKNQRFDRFFEVEEESSTVLDLKTILGKLGHNVVAVASSGEEAMQCAGDLNPDLILINIKLKGEMSGVEAANKILNLYKIPIIFLTVFINNCLNKSLQLPEDAIVLTKPIKQEHLKHCIKRAFSENK